MGNQVFKRRFVDQREVAGDHQPSGIGIRLKRRKQGAHGAKSQKGVGNGGCPRKGFHLFGPAGDVGFHTDICQQMTQVLPLRDVVVVQARFVGAHAGAFPTRKDEGF